jgi:ribulose-5-phosphate 4-epimerase/fuculose-1-phosphate aldolase
MSTLDASGNGVDRATWPDVAAIAGLAEPHNTKRGLRGHASVTAANAVTPSQKVFDELQNRQAEHTAEMAYRD